MTAVIGPTTIGGVRPVTSTDLSQVRELLARNPIRHCFVSSRVDDAGADPWRLGGELLGYFSGDTLLAMLYVGANLVPVETTATSRAAFVDRLRRRPRRCSSFVGPADEVLDLWRLMEPSWGPAREVRASQPLLAIYGDCDVDADTGVRPTSRADLDVLVPACIAMFTVEVGVSPVVHGNSSGYRARIEQLVDGGRSFARIDGDCVVFKAEIGSVSQGVCQVQGVWVDPALRGRGLAKSGMAATVRLARERIAPVVSLYVNDFNTPALKTYRSVGFREHDVFATVLF